MKNKCRLAAIKKIFPGCHAEISKNVAASRQYCVKKKTRVEGPYYFGEIGVKGKVRMGII